MLWIYDRRVPKQLPLSYFDPKHEGRAGRVLSQQAYNFVRKRQLEYCFANRHQRRLCALLTPETYPILEWPVLIGHDHEAVAILADSALGSGAYGKVFVAVSLDTGRFLAVKLQRVNIDDPLKLNEAESEFNNLTKMDKLVDYYVVNQGHYDDIFLVSPYAHGIDYFTALFDKDQNHKNQKREIPFETQLEMALAAGKAVLNFHQKGFVHRDLSLKNMIWDEDHKQCTLVDMAKALRLRYAGTIFAPPDGTLLYMAPELSHLNKDGNACYSEKSDVYALGVILCEIFAKQELRFDALHQFTNFAKTEKLTGIPALLKASAPDIFQSKPRSHSHKRVYGLIKEMVNADPDKRPSMPMVIHHLVKAKHAHQHCQKKVKTDRFCLK